MTNTCKGIDPRTLQTLDWPDVLSALSLHAQTLRGQRTAKTPIFASTLQEASTQYSAVQEVLTLTSEHGDCIPLGEISDIADLITKTSSGATLSEEDLLQIARCLHACRFLRQWIEDRQDITPTLRDLVDPIEIDDELIETLQKSFEETGGLSERMYPILNDLRTRNQVLSQKIRGILNDLIEGDQLSGMLQDRFITERSGRFVLPVKTGYKRSVGVVHGTSQSGETVYVEPLQVIALTNELKEGEASLSREITRILRELSRSISQEAPAIHRSLQSAESIDIVIARALLGESWNGNIPIVGHDGEISLKNARHPILQLRGVDVVGNDLNITDQHPGLVLTGSNAGGKTIALKTLGLCALMVRAGIPLPAQPKTRVDFFPAITADIGDLQTVQGDLSTFSGHLYALKELVDSCADKSLVLLDEIGVGTDPVQGAALAQAVVQELLDSGARVVLTTHYARLKNLPQSDPRVLVGAVRFVKGKPTYHFDLGVIGQSHALAIARSLSFPERLIDRARVLLTEAEKRMDTLLTELEDEKQTVHLLQTELRKRTGVLEELEDELKRREATLEKKRQGLEQSITDNHRAVLQQQADEVRALIAHLQANPSIKQAGETLQGIRQKQAGVRTTTQSPPDKVPRHNPVVGDKVWLKDLTTPAIVIELLSSGDVEVQVGQIRMKVKRVDIHRVASKAKSGSPTPLGTAKKTKQNSTSTDSSPASSAVTVRSEVNTCDLRGMRVDEAVDESSRFLARMILTNHSSAYLLHGHGTGALKTAIRDWLKESPQAKHWRPATMQEGGDAYTVVEPT